MQFLKRIFANRIGTFIIVSLLSIFSLTFFGITYINSNNQLNDKDSILVWNDSAKEESSHLNNQELIISNKISKAVLSVNGLSCSSCVQDIKDALSTMKGIEKIFVDVAAGKAQIYFDNKRVQNAESIAEQISNVAGYPAVVKKVFDSDELIKEKEMKDRLSDVYIASVGDWDISKSDYNNELNAAKIQYSARYGNDIFNTAQGETLEANLKSQITSQLINEGYILQDILKADYKVDKEVVEKEFNAFLNNNSLTKEQFQEKIKENGFTSDYFLKKFETRVLINRYLDNMVFLNASNPNEKQVLYNQWFNNIKSLVEVTYYDTELEQANIASSSAGGSCCE